MQSGAKVPDKVFEFKLFPNLEILLREFASNPLKAAFDIDAYLKELDN